jgi:hypothetical protein
VPFNFAQRCARSRCRRVAVWHRSGQPRRAVRRSRRCPPILYLTVSVGDDGYITPAKSLLLDGAGDSPTTCPRPWREIESGNFRYTHSSTHDDILHSEALADLCFSRDYGGPPEPGGHASAE